MKKRKQKRNVKVQEYIKGCIFCGLQHGPHGPGKECDPVLIKRKMIIDYIYDHYDEKPDDSEFADDPYSVMKMMIEEL